MPRKGEVPKREVEPDPVFGSRIVTKFINCLMKGGKKSVAEKIFYGAMGIIAEKSGRNPTEVFRGAIQNVMPVVEVRPRRVGGATYQVPVEVPPRRQLTLAIRWLITAARARHERIMAERLAGELMDAAAREGEAMRRREDVQRMAEANRAYSHYRW